MFYRTATAETSFSGTDCVTLEPRTDVPVVEYTWWMEQSESEDATIDGTTAFVGNTARPSVDYEISL
jgi:hypothetical protein